MTAEEYYRTLSHRESVDVPEALELLQLYMRDHGLEGWRAQINKRTPIVRAGRSYPDAKVIWLNEWVVCVARPAYLRDMILHEIAHALLGDEGGHSKAWEDKALELGVSRESILNTRKALEEVLEGLPEERKAIFRKVI